MEIREFLARLVAMPGISGHEDSIAQAISQAFEPYCQKVRVDRLYNVYGLKTDIPRKGMPKVMVAAHMDEIGLMVTDIDERGFIRFTSVGGVDPRILLAQEVEVHGKQKLFGVIGAKPPHIQQSGEAQKAVKMKDMVIDLGLPVERVKELVSIGDIVTFVSPLKDLKGQMVSAKSLDDRAGVAVLLQTMKELNDLRFSAEVSLTLIAGPPPSFTAIGFDFGVSPVKVTSTAIPISGFKVYAEVLAPLTPSSSWTVNTKYISWGEVLSRLAVSISSAQPARSSKAFPIYLPLFSKNGE